MRIPMLFRFSLYGFLKNQQYYDPFIILAFLDKGLSFTLIGLLIGFRELSVNLMEVPSGAVADLFGRRRSMILSFSSYIAAFAIFATSTVLWHLFAAMFCFAVGEAFRTGTHKAMILHWLRLQGRESEKTKTYGFTRSWSKMGSAVAVLIATAIVLTTGSYVYTFLFAIVPYVLGIVNFLGYPRELDDRPEHPPSLRDVAAHLGRAFRQAFGQRRLRRVLVEAMGYESTYKVSKDYLQPVLKQMAIGLPVLVALGVDTRTAILVGCFYFALHFLSSVASRKSLGGRREPRGAAALGAHARRLRACWAGAVVPALLARSGRLCRPGGPPESLAAHRDHPHR